VRKRSIATTFDYERGRLPLPKIGPWASRHTSDVLAAQQNHDGRGGAADAASEVEQTAA
jgi:hypothetical protein